MILTEPVPATVAIFDIGSNAVRLTAHRISAGRAEQVIKEVTLCEMGRPHARTGYLYPEGVKRAYSTLQHYSRMIRDPRHPCTGVVAVATDAIRRATDGPEFMRRVHDDFGINIRILSEEEEGRFGAHGVLLKIPGADGIVADMGGGSLQLTRVGNGAVGTTCSRPLGALRLLAVHDQLDAEIDRQLADIPDDLRESDTLYVIGGSWRSLAKLYLARAQLTTKDVQGVELAPDKIRSIATALLTPPVQLGQATLMADYGVEKSRAELMPFAAHLLVRLIDMLGADRIVVSTAGVRDGILQAVIDGQLPPDPL